MYSKKTYNYTIGRGVYNFFTISFLCFRQSTTLNKLKLQVKSLSKGQVRTFYEFILSNNITGLQPDQVRTVFKTIYTVLKNQGFYNSCCCFVFLGHLCNCQFLRRLHHNVKPPRQGVIDSKGCF